MFILDFTDAFWQIPLASEERKHFIGFDGWMFRRAAHSCGARKLSSQACLSNQTSQMRDHNFMWTTRPSLSEALHLFGTKQLRQLSLYGDSSGSSLRFTKRSVEQILFGLVAE